MALEKATIRVQGLEQRHPGITPALAESYFEAASVCLARHHGSPVELELVVNGSKQSGTVDFEKPDTRTLNAWANDIDTTEAGAYGLCLAAVEATEELVAVRRAETLTGADWYLAPRGSEIDDLEASHRLEVSGVDSGGRGVVESRLAAKVQQTRRGKCNLPAIAAVAGFKTRFVAILRVKGNE